MSKFVDDKIYGLDEAKANYTDPNFKSQSNNNIGHGGHGHSHSKNRKKDQEENIDEFDKYK